jgi:hypothetical protein
MLGDTLLNSYGKSWEKNLTFIIVIVDSQTLRSVQGADK